MKFHRLLLLTFLLCTPVAAPPTDEISTSTKVHLRNLTADVSIDQDPCFSPDGEHIVFVSYRSARQRLWIVPAAGGQPRQLTSGKDFSQDWYPTFSPDGKFIAFSSTRGGQTHIWAIPATGGEPRRVTAEALNTQPSLSACTWSPDGKFIAYTSGDKQTFWGGEERTIHMVPATGGESRRLEYGIAPAVWPRFSPDGRWLAFQSGEFPLTNFFIAPAAGGRPIQISEPDSLNGLVPRWSPDGRKLVFLGRKGANMRLAVVPVSGGALHVLVEGLSPWEKPTWSPDGKTIVFEEALKKILAVPATGGPLATLWSEPTSFALAPAWSPNGDRIAFSIRQRDALFFAIFNLFLSSGDIEPVTIGSSHHLQVAFSPDGEILAYTSDQSGNLDIWTMPADGGRPVQLTTDPGRDENPFWLPGGEEIAFLSERSGRRQVWAAPDGGGAPRLFFSTADGTGNFDISPDGKFIVYEPPPGTGGALTTSTGLRVAELPTGIPRLLDLHGWKPAFSPDGKYIAYFQGGLPHNDIWIADVGRIVDSRPDPTL